MNEMFEFNCHSFSYRVFCLFQSEKERITNQNQATWLFKSKEKLKEMQKFDKIYECKSIELS